MKQRIALLLTAWLAMSACRTSNQHSDTLFIRTGQLIDGIHAEVHENVDIIVVSGRIALLGKGLKTPGHARVIDLSAFTVLPTPLIHGRAAGLKPMAEIQAATSGAAKRLGLENKVGSISPGLNANFIAIDGDPLKDVTALERVRVRIKEGIIHTGSPPEALLNK